MKPGYADPSHEAELRRQEEQLRVQRALAYVGALQSLEALKQSQRSCDRCYGLATFKGDCRGGMQGVHSRCDSCEHAGCTCGGVENETELPIARTVRTLKGIVRDFERSL